MPLPSPVSPPCFSIRATRMRNLWSPPVQAVFPVWSGRDHRGNLPENRSGFRRFVEIGTAPLENNTAMSSCRGGADSGWMRLFPTPFPGSGRRGQRRKTVERSISEPRKRLSAHFKMRVRFGSGFFERGCRLQHVSHLGTLPQPSPSGLVVQKQPASGVSRLGRALREGCGLGFVTRYGVSLKALERLTRGAGYPLVGCELSGMDAFFVRDDLLGDQFHAPDSAEHHGNRSAWGLMSKRATTSRFLPASPQDADCPRMDRGPLREIPSSRKSLCLDRRATCRNAPVAWPRIREAWQSNLAADTTWRSVFLRRRMADRHPEFRNLSRCRRGF